MKLKDILTLETSSVNPQNKPESIWHLYSLPSFDEGKRCEQVLGKEILSNKYLVPGKCILYNKLNVRFKRIWAVFNANEFTICSTEFLPLVVNENVADFNYAYHLLHSDQITNYLTGQNTNTSGSHKRIDPNDFLNIDVNIPSIEEQKRIGLILSNIERKINLNSEINQNLEASLQLLFEYTFIQNACSNWTYVPLKEFADIVNGATPSTSNENNYGGDIVWITPKDLSDQSCKFVFHGSRNITKMGYDSCSTTIVPQGTIVMSSRAPIGLLSIAKTSLCTNQGFKSLVPKDIKSSEYLYYYIKYHIPQIQQLGTGTTFKEVSRDDMSKFKILCPDDSTLSKWHNKVSNVFDKQFAIVKEIEKLTQLRDELLPLLMNGQVSVTQLNSDLLHD